MIQKLKWPLLLLIAITAILLIFIRPSVFSSSEQNETLLGTDSNKNSIRDDVDEYIQKRFPKSQKQRAALSQLAKDYQDAFAIYDDPEKLKKIVNNIDETHWCLDGIFGALGLDEGHALMAELFNNAKRSAAGIHIETLLFEIPLNLPKTGEDKIKKCNFDPTKMEN